MWWNSSSTFSACSAEIAVNLATSRLTFPTSSSLSCCSNCALAPSPSATSVELPLVRWSRSGGSDNGKSHFRTIGDGSASRLGCNVWHTFDRSDDRDGLSWWIGHNWLGRDRRWCPVQKPIHRRYDGIK